MARNRRRNRWQLLAAIAIPAAVAGFMIWPEAVDPEPQTGVARSPEPATLETTSSETVVPEPADATPVDSDPNLTLVAAPGPAAAPGPGVVTNRGLNTASDISETSSARAAEHLAKAEQAESDNKIFIAREHYSHALDRGLSPEQEETIRRRLFDIADKTIFNRRRMAGDPLTDTHVIASGDNLQRIAAKYKVTAGLIARINNINNPNVIRAGQPLKVVHGPFHARVDKSAYVMWIYLQDVLVASYRVGLGENGKTPTGAWRIKAGSKLQNPTYFDPYGGPTIHADDPKNPLGEHWIGLEGVSGDAVGKDGFGIHGTIEPDSIGKSESLGCVRLLNEDVTQVFDLLVPVHSVVTIRP